MRAVRYHGNGVVRVDQIADPIHGREDVLLAPLAVGICGSDILIVDGHYSSSPPVVLGHEICARVIAVGDDVASLSVGDLVTVEPHLYDGTCLHCQIGKPHLCPNRRAPGVHLNGGMAELLAVPQTIAYSLPAETPPHIGAMTEPVACCVHAIDRLQATSGLPIAIFGSGPAGAILISLAKLAGLTPIVAVEPRRSRRELAIRMGADIALDPADPEFHSMVMKHSNGYGFPYVIDAVGSSRTLESAVQLASRGGTIIVFGVAKPDDYASVRPNEIYAKELSILGSALNPFTHRRAANLISELPLDEFKVRFFGMSEIEEALDSQRSGRYDKVFVVPNGAGE